MNIIGSRRSKANCGDNQFDLPIYVKETEAFALLLSKPNWPSSLAGLSFELTKTPSIPPQLSLLIRHVDLRIDFIELEREIKHQCPDVKNVARLKNKFGNYCNLIIVELTTVNSRKQLLSAKKLKINHIVYDVTEFLAPINVLICSKCCGIGHFRKQCPDQLETCRTCSQQFHEGSQHVCSNQTRCKHCNGDHSSNSNKCPVIKSFRFTLTRQMLTRNEPTNRHPATDKRPNISFGLNQRHNFLHVICGGIRSWC
jgi:hypothetical protein